MHYTEEFKFMFGTIWNHYYLIDIALTDLYLYNITVFVFMCFVLYVFCYLWYVDIYHCYVDVMVDALNNTILDIVTSVDDGKPKNGAYMIKAVMIGTLYACVIMNVVYFCFSAPILMKMIHTVNSVTFFYMFWGFSHMFTKNLKLLLENEKNIPFVIMDYLVEGDTYFFIWNSVYSMIDLFNDLLFANMNAHYAFVWSIFFVLYICFDLKFQ